MTDKITLKDFRTQVVEALYTNREGKNPFGVIMGMVDDHYDTITIESLGYSKSDGYKDNGTAPMGKKGLADKLWEEAHDLGWVNTYKYEMSKNHTHPKSIEYQLRFKDNTRLKWNISDTGYELSTGYGQDKYIFWEGTDPTDPYLEHLISWIQEVGPDLSGYKLSKLVNLILLAYENRPDYTTSSWRLLPYEDAFEQPDPHARMSEAPAAYTKPHLLGE